MLFLADALDRLVDRVGQVRRGTDQIIAETRHEAGVDLRAVRVFNGRIRDDHVRAIPARGGEEREIWREQKEWNMVGLVEGADLRQNRERWIIHHHRAARIVEPFVIAAWIERAHHLIGVYIVFPARPILYRLIHFGGGIAVVRGFLRFEFLHERAVIVNRLLSDAHFESPKSKAPPPNGEGADLKTGCKNFHKHHSALNFFHASLIFEREFESHAGKSIMVRRCAADCRPRRNRTRRHRRQWK